ncbi:MAG: hypothetical protein JW943_08070 [Deltaproteobacteria bacterium]|nr:hypothetical protein [Deltaproteobacteria bacterium]
MKKSRFELSYLEIVRRSFYVFLRDELERRLRVITFEKIYKQCRDKGLHYPYVDPREMRPRKREFARESTLTLPYIIIFCEESLGEAHQKYIRFSNDNRIRKDTLALVPGIQLNKPFYSGIKYFERKAFFDFLETLIDVDYGLLIQRDDRYRKKNRYALSHFHVKIDWPIAEAAESLGKEMRYISKSLYEKGERPAALLQDKLFEYYGWHHQATGGRRTAALIAAQYLKQVPGLTTVYVSSSETRTLTRYSEKGVARYAIIQLDKDYAHQIIEANRITPEAFRLGYALGESEGFYDVMLFVIYKHTEWGQPPVDGKLRIIKPDFNWLAVESEMILPLSTAFSSQPLVLKWIYRSEKEK